MLLSSVSSFLTILPLHMSCCGPAMGVVKPITLICSIWLAKIMVEEIWWLPHPLYIPKPIDSHLLPLIHLPCCSCSFCIIWMTFILPVSHWFSGVDWHHASLVLKSSPTISRHSESSIWSHRRASQSVLQDSGQFGIAKRNAWLNLNAYCDAWSGFSSLRILKRPPFLVYFMHFY
jgi:hypothetical protein